MEQLHQDITSTDTTGYPSSTKLNTDIVSTGTCDGRNVLETSLELPWTTNKETPIIGNTQIARNISVIKTDIISVADYTNDDFLKFAALLTPESQQVVSLDKLEQLKQDLDKKTLTCFKDGQAILKHITAETNSMALKYKIDEILKYLKVNNKLMLYSCIDNDVFFKDFFSEMLGCDEFTCLILNLSCKYDPDYNYCAILAIAQFLYNKVDKSQVKEQKILAFMRLALNVAFQATATENCKVKLLIEVLSLIEHDCDCKQQMEDLSKDINNNDVFYGEITATENRILIETFRAYKLTTEQQDIKPKNNSTNCQPQEELKASIQAIPKVGTEKTKDTINNVEKVTSKQLQAEIELPTDIFQFPNDIINAIAYDAQQIEDYIQDIIIEIKTRKANDNLFLFVDTTIVENQTLRHPPAEIYNSSEEIADSPTKYFNKAILKDINDINDMNICANNEADFIEQLLIYNNRTENKNNRIYRIVSTLTLEIYLRFHNRDIKPLIELLILANELEKTQITAQNKLNILVKIIYLIYRKKDYATEIDKFRASIPQLLSV